MGCCPSVSGKKVVCSAREIRGACAQANAQVLQSVVSKWCTKHPGENPYNYAWPVDNTYEPTVLYKLINEHVLRGIPIERVVSCVKIVLESGFDCQINRVSKQLNAGWPISVLAIVCGYWSPKYNQTTGELISMILSHGASSQLMINKTWKYSMTPLMCYCKSLADVKLIDERFSNAQVIVPALIQAGSPINHIMVLNNGEQVTALSNACKTGHIMLILTLLMSGAHIHSECFTRLEEGGKEGLVTPSLKNKLENYLKAAQIHINQLQQLLEQEEWEAQQVHMRPAKVADTMSKRATKILLSRIGEGIPKHSQQSLQTTIRVALFQQKLIVLVSEPQDVDIADQLVVELCNRLQPYMNDTLQEIEEETSIIADVLLNKRRRELEADARMKERLDLMEAQVAGMRAGAGATSTGSVGNTNITVTQESSTLKKIGDGAAAAQKIYGFAKMFV